MEIETIEDASQEKEDDGVHVEEIRIKEGIVDKKTENDDCVKIMDIDIYQAALYYATSDEIVRGRSFLSVLEHGEKLTKTNYHKNINAYYTRYRMLFVVSGLFFLQLMLLFWLNVSIVARSCHSSEECVRGAACIEETSLSSRKFRSACYACDELDDNPDLINSTVSLTTWVERTCFEILDDYNLMKDYNQNKPNNIKLFYKYSASRTYRPKVFVQFCIGCIDASFQYTTLSTITRRQFLVMRTGDYFALLTCALAVALALVKELREIKLLELAQRHALRRRDFHHTKKKDFWRFKRSHLWFALLVDLRQYLLVPGVLAAIARLVAITGTDGVSIVFNVVAVVFVVELDNLLSELLADNTKEAIRANNGQLQLTPAEAKYVSIFQRIYLALLPISIILALAAEAWYPNRNSQGTPPSTVVAAIPVLLVSSVEVILFKDRPLAPTLLIASIFPKFCCQTKKRRLALGAYHMKDTISQQFTSDPYDKEHRAMNTTRMSSASLISNTKKSLEEARRLQKSIACTTSNTTATVASIWHRSCCGGAENDATLTLLPWRNPFHEPAACLFDLTLHFAEYMTLTATAAAIMGLIINK
mmetsp:Transcript_5472/g.7705  ORF Transcript_5472/g.7705 Transcript_5472/m.7705 type:complete len:590 (+) Transcript_5472:155-1924(+)